MSSISNQYNLLSQCSLMDLRASALGYSTLPWIIILPIISEYYGRKKPFILSNIITITGTMVFCLSTSATQILISYIIAAINTSCCTAISIVIATEYTSPQYRGLFLTLKSAMFFWGIWAANAIGTFFYWKYIGVFMILCNIYCLISFLWPESPYWLAANGLFDECIASHRWLNGTGTKAEDELNKLIISQKDYLTNRQQRKFHISRSRILNFIRIFSYKSCYKPTLIGFASLLTYNFSGKLTCSVYAVEIIKKITGNEAAAYRGMLILDAVSVFCMYFGSYLSRILKRRTLFLTGSLIGTILLFIMSLYLYLVKLSYIVENNIISIILLVFFSAGVSCGPMILSTSVFAELLPLQYKNVIVIVSISISNFVMSTVLKLAPYLFNTFGVHGAFLYFGVMNTIFIFILFKYLPETKDKTLQEIEEHFKN